MSLNPNPELADLVADPSRVANLPLQAVPALRAELAKLDTLLLMRLTFPQSNGGGSHVGSLEGGQYELIDSPELAKRWSVPESWVRDCVRNRSGDPIPCVRLGRYVRFEWGSPDLEAWFGRRKEGKKKQLDRKMVSVYQ